MVKLPNIYSYSEGSHRERIRLLYTVQGALLYLKILNLKALAKPHSFRNKLFNSLERGIPLLYKDNAEPLCSDPTSPLEHEADNYSRHNFIGCARLVV